MAFDIVISLSFPPGHKKLQGNNLPLVHREAHEDEAIHVLSAIGVHMLAIIEEKFVDPR